MYLTSVCTGNSLKSVRAYAGPLLCGGRQVEGPKEKLHQNCKFKYNMKCDLIHQYSIVNLCGINKQFY